jgi:hypothetical protein
MFETQTLATGEESRSPTRLGSFVAASFEHDAADLYAWFA